MGADNELIFSSFRWAIMKAKEDKVTELRIWKEKIDDVTSPTQLKNLIDEVLHI